MRDGAVGGGAARVHRRASLRMAVNGRSGANPEAADLNLSFRSAPKADHPEWSFSA